MAETSENMSEAIETNATGPKQASGDEGSMTQHSLTEQIAADKHLANKSATANQRFGLRIAKMNQPGPL